MKIRRSFAVLLSLSLLMLIFPCVIAEGTDEFNLAIEYGFVSEKLKSENPDVAISYAEFMAMLDAAVSRIDAQRLSGWKAAYPEARNCTDSIDWGNAALAVFSAAEYLGGDVYYRNCDDVGEGAFEGEWTPAAFWGDAYRPPFGFEGMPAEEAKDHCFESWSSHYLTSRASMISGKTIYSYEEGNAWISAYRNLTVKEAALAAMRFWESTIHIDQRMPNEEDAALFANVEAKKQEILNSETDISYSGTAYYVSNGGDDQNDGRSPETAWATLDKVNEAGAAGTLRPGDAVLLERGGLWRGFINCAQGVTYSAYGEGAKPKIYGSEENGAGTEKWELWHDQDGVKIWKFYRDISEVGNIVFNDGEFYATRVYAYFNGENWVNSGADQTPFNVAERLIDDLTFSSIIDLDKATYEEYVREFGEGNLYTDCMDTTGKLYMRCDAGNPGEIYSEIEFHMQPEGLMGYLGLVNPAGENVIDNLCIKYSLVNGIAIYGTDQYNTDNNNNTIQNCEIAWTGGTQHELCRPDGTVMVCGENIVFKTDGNVFQNNYMYQSACGGFVSEFVPGEWEGYPEPLCKNNVMRGNVIEKCQDNFWFWNNIFEYFPDEFIFWDNTLIEDNYSLYMGYGWSSDPRFTFTRQPLNEYHRDGATWQIAIGVSKASEARNMVIQNNVFYLSNGGMIVGAPDIRDQANTITFSGNTYVQNDNRFIVTVGDNQSAMPNSLTVEAIKEDLEYFLGDEDAVVFATSVAR